VSKKITLVAAQPGGNNRPMRRPTATLAGFALTFSLAACGQDGGQGEVRHENDERVATPGRTATPASPPAGAAPADPYAVGVRTLRLNRGGDRPLRVTIWYPATGDAAAGAAAARGRFPLVLFSHGLTGTPEDYRELLSRWAAGGFVVAAPAYPHTSRGADRVDVLDVLNQPADASYVITSVLALDGERGDPLRGRIDASRVGAAGHSAGGVTTIGLFTVGRDDRLDAGIVLAGSALGMGSRYTGTAAPLLFVHGGRDDVVPYRDGRAAYDAVPWPKAMLTLPGGDHGWALRRTADPGFRVVAASTLNFLRWSLYGDEAARRRLGESGAAGVATLDDRL
jgi:fermentation-respiration switch protein FrsA (DUF1100 family)